MGILYIENYVLMNRGKQIIIEEAYEFDRITDDLDR